MYLEGFPVLHQEKVLDDHDTDDVVNFIFIYRDAGIHGFPEQSQQLSVCRVDIDRGHVDAGNHDVLCHGVAELKYIVDQFLLLLFDHTVLVAHIDVGFQLGLCHHDARRLVDMEDTEEKAGDLVDDKDDRCQRLHQKIDHPCVGEGQLLVVAHRPCLWHDLTEYEDDQSQYAGADPHGCISPYPYDQGSHERGSADIDDIVADQYRADQFAFAVEDLLKRENSSCGVFIDHGTHLDVAQSGEGSLCRREKC